MSVIVADPLLSLTVKVAPANWTVPSSSTSVTVAGLGVPRARPPVTGGFSVTVSVELPFSVASFISASGMLSGRLPWPELKSTVPVKSAVGSTAAGRP